MNLGEDVDTKLIANGDKVVDIVALVRQFKSVNKVSLKTFIKDITITSSITDFLKQAETDIKAVCSINEIDYKDGDTFNVEIGEIVPEENTAE